MRTVLISLLLVNLFPVAFLFGQFAGGSGDGNSVKKIFASKYISQGGIGDGYDQTELINSIYSTFGGSGDGYSADTLMNQNYISEGGSGDGYKLSVSDNLTSIALGGIGDGYQLDNAFLKEKISRGGGSDGYASMDEFQLYIWTGEDNVNWHNPENWISFAVPRLRHTVIIPGNPDNYPVLEAAGLFSIGIEKNESLYKCKELIIEKGGIIYFIDGVWMENYGKIINRGNMEFYNFNPNAFQNLQGGILELQGGYLYIGPE